MYQRFQPMRLQKNKEMEQDSRPQPGDTLVTLRCDEDLPLEERVEIMAYAFAKLVQGSILRTVVSWNISEGCIQFVIGHVGVAKPARGTVSARLQEASKVEGLVVETEKFVGKDK